MRILAALAILLLLLTVSLPAQTMVDRMMAFDKNHDGKLTRDEITDDRLLRLFDRADTNHDGIVTKEELEALNAQESQANSRGPGGPGGGGRGGPGGGRGGRGGFGPPQPGQIVPGFMQDRLNLTDAQKKQIEALQKEVDAKLDSILTPEQKKQWKEGDRPGPPQDIRR